MKMHLSLRVSDLGRSVEFYSAIFGAPPHKQRPGYANFDLADPPLKLALTQNPIQPGAGSLDHLGFLLPDASALEAVKCRLQDAGLATFDETDTTCCYARQDKIWAHDPDGNEWELYVLLDDLSDDFEHDHAGNPLPMIAAASTSQTSIRIEPAHRCCGS